MATAATRMDAIYRRQRHVYDLTRKYYLLGRDRLIERLEVPNGGSVLELGCGTGRNLIAAARRYPGARCFGLDVSEAMLATAHISVSTAGMSERIKLVHADASAFEPTLFASGGLDRVFMSYTLSMIPDWRQVIERGIAALAPGGTLHIVDFGRQEHLPRWWRAALFAWLGHFEVTPRAGLRAVLEDAAERHGLMLDFQPLYRGYAWSAVLRGGIRNVPAGSLFIPQNEFHD